MTRLDHVSQPPRGMEHAARAVQSPGLPVPGRKVHGRRGVTGGGATSLPRPPREHAAPVDPQQLHVATAQAHMVARAVAQLIASLQVWSLLARPALPEQHLEPEHALHGLDTGPLNIDLELPSAPATSLMNHAEGDPHNLIPAGVSLFDLPRNIPMIDDRIDSVPAVPLGGRGPTGDRDADSAGDGARSSGDSGKAAAASTARYVWLAVVAVIGIPGLVLTIAWLAAS